MGLIDGLLKSGMCDGLLEQMAQKTGLDASNLSSVINKIAPELMNKTTQNIKGDVDSSGLIDLIQKANVENIDIDNGNALLGELLGSKDASRSLAAQVAGSLGIGEDKIKSLLPMIAQMTAGAINKNSNITALKGSDTSALTSMLSSFLDQNKDGSIADDLLGLASKFFKK